MKSIICIIGCLVSIVVMIVFTLSYLSRELADLINYIGGGILGVVWVKIHSWLVGLDKLSDEEEEACKNRV